MHLTKLVAPQLLWHCAAVAAADYGVHLRRLAKEQFAKLPPGVRRQVLHGFGRYAPWESGFDFTPPPLCIGEEVGPPDFVGIGVQKCGTTWWYELMMTHPRLFHRPDIHKERHFLDQFGVAPFGASDIERYSGWFPRPQGTATGEWTPDYFGLPWVPLLLKLAAPEARLLLLLRDPVERLRSGLAHMRRMGNPLGPSVIADALQRGFYHRLLDDWLTHFDSKQLLVLQYEQCVADPAGQLRSTFRFLGLSDSEMHHDQSTEPSRPVDAPPGSRTILDPAIRRRLVDYYESDVMRLAGQLPELDLTLWPNFSHLSGGKGARDGGPNSPSRRA
jgi:hypothetical protein